MENITLGKTGITTPQNGFEALPIQRDDIPTAVKIRHCRIKKGEA